MWWYVGLHRWMIDRIRALDNDGRIKVLDCGAGTGGFARKLAEEMTGADLFALDIDAAAISLFVHKSRRPVVQGSINALCFRADCFDVAVSSDVLYHSAVDEPKAIAELHRCLKSGGSLLVNLPAYNWMKSSHDKRVHTARRYTASSAARKLRTAGFEIREATYRNSLLFPVMALFRVTVGRFKTTSDVDNVPAWQNSLFGAVMSLENALARRGVRFPFGGSVYVHAVKI